MTLADEDTKSILTDKANRAIQGNVAMQVTQPGGQHCKQCKWCLMTNFEPMQVVPSVGQICNLGRWRKLQLMQVAPSGGQICN